MKLKSRHAKYFQSQSIRIKTSAQDVRATGSHFRELNTISNAINLAQVVRGPPTAQYLPNQALQRKSRDARWLMGNFLARKEI